MELRSFRHRSSTHVVGAKTKNVMVVYQDSQTRDWAVNFYADKLNTGERVRQTWWNIDDLSEPGVLAGAVSTAIRAEVILISAVSGTGLPLPFYVWVDSWLPHRHVTEGKLIAVVGISDRDPGKSKHDMQYLRAMAGRGHMDLVEELRSSQGPREPGPAREGTLLKYS